MPERKTGKKKDAGTVAGLLPELMEKALARRDDFIVTCETDPDTGRKQIHIFSGKFVTPCMLRKLMGKAESQRDEGAVRISKRWR